MIPARVYHARINELIGLLPAADIGRNGRWRCAILNQVWCNARRAHPTYDFNQPLPMATSTTKIPTVALTGKPAPKRPALRLPLDVSPAEDVAKGRRAWPRVQTVVPGPVARSYSAAVQAVGGLATPNKYEYK